MPQFILSSASSDEVTIPEMLEAAAQAGFDGLHLEVREGVHVDTAEVLAASDASGCPVVSVGFSADLAATPDFPSYVRESLQLAAAVKAKRSVITSSPRPSRPAELIQCLRTQADELRAVLDSDVAQDIEVCLRITPKTLVHDHYSAAGFMQLVDHFSVSLLFDPVSLCDALVDYTQPALASIEDRVSVFALRGAVHTADGLDPCRLIDTTLYLTSHLTYLAKIEFSGHIMLGSCLPPGSGAFPEVVRKELTTAVEFFTEAAQKLL